MIIHKLSERYRTINPLIQKLKGTSMYPAYEEMLSRLITQDPFMEAAKQQARMLADRKEHVLILGPTGTGKELLAAALHGTRDPRLRINLNCTAITPELMESLIFGHEQGAFTGATFQHKGYLEMASGGTIFLDEIGDMPLDLQAKLLRVMETSVFRRLGGSTTYSANVRFIAATNKSLEAIREDILHRFTWRIETTPLDKRPEDIPLICAAVGFPEFTPTPEDLKGNVRSLIAAIQRYKVYKDNNLA